MLQPILDTFLNFFTFCRLEQYCKLEHVVVVTGNNLVSKQGPFKVCLLKI